MSTIPEGCFYVSYKENTVELHSSCKAIEKSSFYYFHGTITLNEGLEIIGDEAFEDGLLTSIVIPSTVRYIGKLAFHNCYYLESIVIPSSVTYIGEGCFSRCYDLKSAIIGEGITKLPPRAFSECVSLSNIIFLGRITSFGSDSLYSTNISQIQIPPNCICEDRSFGFGDIKMIEMGYNSVIAFEFFQSTCLNIVLKDNATLIRTDQTNIQQVNLYYVGSAKYDHEIDQSLYYLLNFSENTKVFVTPRYRSCTFCGIEVTHTYFNPFETQFSLRLRLRRLVLEIEHPKQICDFNAYVTHNDAYFIKKVHKLVPSLSFCNSIFIKPS